MNIEVKRQQKVSWKASLTAVASVIVAFVASQHHLIHMLIQLVTFGSAGMSFMSTSPLLRRSMMLLSLLMMGVTLWQMRRSRQSKWMVVLAAVSLTLTFGLLLWSLFQYGF